MQCVLGATTRDAASQKDSSKEDALEGPITAAKWAATAQARSAGAAGDKVATGDHESVADSR